MNRKGKDFPLRDFYSKIYPTYDRVNHVFTFGRDRAWRREAARNCILCFREGAAGDHDNQSVRILDICTGTGDFVLELARQLSSANIKADLWGYDFSGEMLQEARRKLADAGTTGEKIRISFEEGDVARMPFAGDSFDAAGITFGIRNLVYRNSSAGRHLEEIRRVLKPGGRLIILESGRPASGLWRLFNNIYLRFILPYLGGFLSGNLKAYSYLADSSRNYYSIPEMCGILEEHGFKCLESKALFLGSVMLVVVEKDMP
jgi:demethylmenaquinone methyltransferase/2-methoxy-6-polyprenyl-1,4-benzoquinol methylase